MNWIILPELPIKGEERRGGVERAQNVFMMHLLKAGLIKPCCRFLSVVAVVVVAVGCWGGGTWPRLQHVPSVIDADTLRQGNMHERNEHNIPKYGEIKPSIDLKPGRDERGERSASNQQPRSDAAASSSSLCLTEHFPRGWAQTAEPLCVATVEQNRLLRGREKIREEERGGRKSMPGREFLKGERKGGGGGATRKQIGQMRGSIAAVRGRFIGVPVPRLIQPCWFVRAGDPERLM